MQRIFKDARRGIASNDARRGIASNDARRDILSVNRP